ncbi:MAG: DMT family transporter [Chlamydiota bacterium]
MDLEKKGLLYGLLAAVCYVAMATCVKLSSEANNQTIVFFRSLICVILILPILWKKKVSLRTKTPFWHFMRILVGTITLYCSYYATKHLFLVDAILLYNTIPLFVPFLLLIFYQKKVPSGRFVAAIVGFLGVMCILKPGFSFFNLDGMIGLFSGFTGAGVLLLVQKLSKTEPSERIIGYFFLGSLCISFVPMAISWTPIANFWLWMSLILTGFFAFLYQFCITKAYSYVSATKIGFSAYLSVLFSGIPDFLIWGKIPDIWTLLGGLCIMGGGIYLVLDKEPIPEKTLG